MIGYNLTVGKDLLPDLASATGSISRIRRPVPHPRSNSGFLR